MNKKEQVAGIAAYLIDCLISVGLREEEHIKTLDEETRFYINKRLIKASLDELKSVDIDLLMIKLKPIIKKQLSEAIRDVENKINLETIQEIIE